MGTELVLQDEMFYKSVAQQWQYRDTTELFT